MKHSLWSYAWRTGLVVALWAFAWVNFALQSHQYHAAIHHSDTVTCHALQRGWDSIHQADIVMTEATPIPPAQAHDKLLAERSALATAHKLAERHTLLTTLGPRPTC